MDIKYLTHSEIDKARWDDCIANARNSVIYAYSWYLDPLCADWAALVSDDYEYIMPLPLKLFFGFRIVYKPYFIQKLGIFSASDVTESIVKQFINKATSKFWHLDIGLRTNQDFTLSNLKIRKRSNYVLAINKPYEEIASKYSTDAKKSLKKVNGISIEFNKCYNLAIQNFISEYGEKTGAQLSNYMLFKKAIEKADSKNKVIGVTVYKENQQIASGLFLIDNRRAYYVLGAPTPEGRKSNATHFLIDGFIREYAEKLDLLDFEGSDIKSVAYFYQKWGSMDEAYYQITGTNHAAIRLIYTIKSYLRSIIS